MVDITRELLTNIAPQFYTTMVNGFKSENRTAFNTGAKSLLKLLLDMDEVLSTSEDFLIGIFINKRKTFSLFNYSSSSMSI